MTKHPVRLEGARRADHEGDRHAQGHGQIHADAALADVAQRTAKERTAGKKHHRQRDDPGGPAQQLLHLGGQIARLGHIGGPRVHHHLHHAEARHQPAPQGLAVFAHALVARHGVHGGQGTVAGLAHGRQPLRWQHLARMPHHARALGGCTDLGALHTRNRAQGILDGQGAGRAVHALDDHMRLPQVGRGTRWRAGAPERGPFLRIVQQRLALRIGRRTMHLRCDGCVPGILSRCENH